MWNKEAELTQKLDALENKLANAQKWMARQVEESMHPKKSFLHQTYKDLDLFDRIRSFNPFHHKTTILELWEKRIEAFFVGAAIILFWRGIWALGDQFIFPGHPTLSAFVSIFIGVAILVMSKNFVNQFLDEAVEEAEEFE